jgi:hypothetical protein
MLVKKENVLLIDGDELEKKNLNRQLFNEKSVGMNKAEALGLQYGVEYIPSYFSFGLLELKEDDWLFVCADNNPARFEALMSCDADHCSAIVACNEVTSSEAYYYCPEFNSHPHDPRVYYPELVTDRQFDPRGQRVGCTGEVQERNRQLVSANYMAAALAQHLFVLWCLEYPKMNADVETMNRLPYRLRANLSRLENCLIKDAYVNQPNTTT